MKRIMAIDYGDARTGIAISDLLCSLVGSTTVIHSRVPEKTVAEICRLARENQVEELVMGFPRNMDGTEGPRAELYRDFARQLEAASGVKAPRRLAELKGKQPRFDGVTEKEKMEDIVLNFLR